jgi:hypothetical protein
MSPYTVTWRLWGFKDWISETVWALSYEDAVSKKASENHMIQIRW